MLCPNCRKEIPEKVNSCPYCGVAFQVGISDPIGMPDFISNTFPSELRGINQKIESGDYDYAFKWLRRLFVGYGVQLLKIAGIRSNLDPVADGIHEIASELHINGFITAEEYTFLMKCDEALLKFGKTDCSQLDVRTVFDNVKRLTDGEIIERVTNVVLMKPIETTAPSATEYFSENRKYYGKWADCSIFAEPRVSEYLRLKRMAAEDSSVDAMLDLAIGFHNEKRYWNNNMLINLPRSLYFNADYAYDASYYYYVVLAVTTAFNKWKKGDYEPPAHLGTAIWETWLLWFELCIKTVTPAMSKFYEGEANFPEPRHNWTLGWHQVMDPKTNRGYVYKGEFFNQYHTMDYGYKLIDMCDGSNTLFLNNEFRKFTRDFFLKHPHSVAPVYEDAQEYTMIKLDLMHYIILAMRSEELYCTAIQYNKTESKHKEATGLFLSKEDCDILCNDFMTVGKIGPTLAGMFINEDMWFGFTAMRIILQGCVNGTPSLGFLNSFMFLAEQRSNYVRWKVGAAVDAYPEGEESCSEPGVLNKFGNALLKIKSTL